MNRLACYRTVLYGQVVPAELPIKPTIKTWNPVDSCHSDTGLIVAQPSAVLQLPYDTSLFAADTREGDSSVRLDYDPYLLAITMSTGQTRGSCF